MFSKDGDDASAQVYEQCALLQTTVFKGVWYSSTLSEASIVPVSTDAHIYSGDSIFQLEVSPWVPVPDAYWHKIFDRSSMRFEIRIPTRLRLLCAYAEALSIFYHPAALSSDPEKVKGLNENATMMSLLGGRETWHGSALVIAHNLDRERSVVDLNKLHLRAVNAILAHQIVLIPH